jgi:hypothetical protein
MRNGRGKSKRRAFSVEDITNPRMKAQALAQLSERQAADIVRRPAVNVNQRRAQMKMLLRQRGVMLPESNKRLVIELPGFFLPSLDNMIGSKRRLHQAEAKDSALAALIGYEGAMWRFKKQVALKITTVYPAKAARIDVCNAYDKQLIDFLGKHGLLIFPDDDPAHLKSRENAWAWQSMQEDNFCGTRIRIRAVRRIDERGK